MTISVGNVRCSCFAGEDVVDVLGISCYCFLTREYFAFESVVDLSSFAVFCLERILTRKCMTSHRKAKVELDVVEWRFFGAALIREEPVCSNVLLEVLVEV